MLPAVGAILVILPTPWKTNQHMPGAYLESQRVSHAILQMGCAGGVPDNRHAQFPQETLQHRVCRARTIIHETEDTSAVSIVTLSEVHSHSKHGSFVPASPHALPSTYRCYTIRPCTSCRPLLVIAFIHAACFLMWCVALHCLLICIHASREFFELLRFLY